jgi:hypothetical protein
MENDNKINVITIMIKTIDGEDSWTNKQYINIKDITSMHTTRKNSNLFSVNIVMNNGNSFQYDLNNVTPNILHQINNIILESTNEIKYTI